MSGGKVGRPTGLGKDGGRQKGTPNRATQALREKLEHLGYDPVEELVLISRDPNTPIELQIQIHISLCPYLYPKRKPIDEVVNTPATIEVITNLDTEVKAPNDSAEDRAQLEAGAGEGLSE